MNTPEKCPKCGDEMLHSSDAHREFMCFTVVLKDGKTIEGCDCAKRQRDQLAARVQELEAEISRWAAAYRDLGTYKPTTTTP